MQSLMIERKIQKEFLNSIPRFRNNSYVQTAISRVEKYLEERHPNVENSLESNKKVDNEKNISEEKNELTITAIFQQHTKEETIQTLKEALEVLEQEKDENYPQYLTEFIRINTSGALITMETENYQIDEKRKLDCDRHYHRWKTVL